MENVQYKPSQAVKPDGLGKFLIELSKKSTPVR